MGAVHMYHAANSSFLYSIRSPRDVRARRLTVSYFKENASQAFGIVQMPMHIPIILEY